MKYLFNESKGEGCLIMHKGESSFEQYYFQQKAGFTFHTIAWNTGKTQYVIIDEISYEFEANAVLPIMLNQSFCFEKPEDIVAWQFNREFYGIVNHDAQVGCVGFLFFGPSPTMFLKLDNEQLQEMQRLFELFEEEFISEEDIKSEMLRMLLVRLIIKLTRLGQRQYISVETDDDKFYIMRQYNLLVETHFRKERQVQYYAGLMNKSPKTISNIFSLYSKTTPLQVIHARVVAEAKRLFYYTDKSVKEIADELGFDDSAHFSKFFKNYTTINPSTLKKAVLQKY
jgi:AraC family transcriptional regulator, transcriptional activator of pobA